jgi:hypothetical protein
MHNTKRSIEYARRRSSVFVKPLAQQSALAALGSKRHSRFALHPRSTTNSVKDANKEGQPAQAHAARERGSRRANKDYDRSTD